MRWCLFRNGRNFSLFTHHVFLPSPFSNLSHFFIPWRKRMLSTAVSTTFQRARNLALSFCSTSAASSPLSSIFVDLHGILKSSHPMLCSLQGQLLVQIPVFYQKPMFESISITLFSRLSKVDWKPEPLLTILVVILDYQISLILTSPLVLCIMLTQSLKELFLKPPLS